MLSIFEKWTKAFPPTEPVQPPLGVLAFCLHYSAGMKKPLLIMSMLTTLLAILEVSLFSFMGQLVDWLSNKQPETLLAEKGVSLFIMGGVLLILMPAMVFIHSAVVHQSLMGNYPMSIRWLAHRYMLKQSVSFYQEDFAGRVATKVLQTALSVREAVMKFLDVMVFILVYFISMLVVVAQSDIRLMLPMLVWVCVYISIQFYFVPRIKRVSAQQAEARSVMTGRIVDSYTNINTVKLFSYSQREADYAKESMQGFLSTTYSQMRLVTWLNVCVQSSNYLLSFGVAFLSIWLWMNDAVSVGAIAIAIAMALRLNGMSQWIMWEVGGLFEHIGTVTDGMKTLSKPQMVLDKKGALPLVVQQGNIRFEDVSFHYGKTSGGLNRLTLNIAPGEKVGLVGRSGAGKSTLVNLLMRFYDLESGRIWVDGQDISQVQQDSLRSHIGMVTQDTSLLHRSVRDNILYGRESATEEEMIAAAKQAEAHDFIQTLTDIQGNKGYDAMVGERGVKLSGGQRQRIAIARVLLKDSPLLVLDEATSALDSEVEAAIQKSLSQLMEKKTVIAIAHRLSTIAAMDRLIVLDQGKVVEQGTHDELITVGGIYAQLWNHQTGGFLGEE